MCKSCYWCASCLTNDDGFISTCPVCDTNKMEWLPISQSESYRLDYDDIRGMILEFWTENWRRHSNLNFRGTEVLCQTIAKTCGSKRCNNLLRQRPKRGEGREKIMPYVDYSIYSFCSHCSKPRPQDVIFCPVCHARVRHCKRFKGEKK